MNITKETDTHLNPVTSTADVTVAITPKIDKYYWVLYKSTAGITRELVTTTQPLTIKRSHVGMQNLLNWKEISKEEYTNCSNFSNEEVLEKEVD